MILTLAGCKNQPAQNEATSNVAPRAALELVFPYGSEKEKWINDVTAAFNRSGAKTPSGKAIFVLALPMGSGETIDNILSGRLRAHIASPASAAFIKLGNAESRAKTGKDLIGSADNLVLSPVVIATWKPMAEAIGWGKKPLGWSDILTLARDPKGWSSHGYPQWGKFKFGHTHPEFSNSGLISLFAEAYAASGKITGLSLKDLEKPQTKQFLLGVEQSVVHYGSSTGFFGRKMFSNGPEYLSAAVLYESMVVESRSQTDLPMPVVAIYPKEGTFWSDHPIGVVEREWVTPEHREAAKIYIQYLLARQQQEKALQYGFRPAAVDVPLSAPLDTEHGVDPKEPKTTLEVPPVEVINGLLQLWKTEKKHSNIVLVLDTSGSMGDEGKMQNAKVGARQLVGMLDEGDTFSFLPFSSDLRWSGQDDLVKLKKELVEKDTSGLIEFVETSRTLNDVCGLEGIRSWLRQDIELWKKNDVAALPKGYLLCGPVGTGKTFLVECLAGEARVPVVKMKNFRDKWVGSSEGNLEKIFRLTHALGRCYVFIDEAHQALGRRDAAGGDSGVGGRIYSMLAEEMGSSANRGKVIWVLASSRPDLIEVDLKRPGSVDVKIPLFPTTTAREGFDLLRMLSAKRGLTVPEDAFAWLEPSIPRLLTAGAAEALVMRVYRQVRTSEATLDAVLRDCLAEYQNPIAPEVMEFQIRTAVNEASALEFVPQIFRRKTS